MSTRSAPVPTLDEALEYDGVMPTARFQPSFFDFLKQLKGNNEREWFQANKPRFEREVRDPMLAFLRDLKPRLAKQSKAFIVDDRPVGGSLFRIYRDVRFGKDKTPYKTSMSAFFHHARGEGSAPGFYVSIGPGESFAGAGIYQPEPEALGRIRDAIVASPSEWKRATKGLELGGESLVRAPKGFDPEHPLIDALKKKGFVVRTRFSETEVCRPGFLDAYVASCKRHLPLVRFLCGAMGLVV